MPPITFTHSTLGSRWTSAIRFNGILDDDIIFIITYHHQIPGEEEAHLPAEDSIITTRIRLHFFSQLFCCSYFVLRFRSLNRR